MKLALGSDHAGYELRLLLGKALRAEGHEIEHFGADGPDPFDYPDASDFVANAVLDGHAELGVLVCGTGIGVSIRANRYLGIRAALCCSPETASLARQHNDANVVCVGSRTTEPEFALEIVRTFIEGSPSREPRHQSRVSKLDGPFPP